MAESGTWGAYLPAIVTAAFGTVFSVLVIGAVTWQISTIKSDLDRSEARLSQEIGGVRENILTITGQIGGIQADIGNLKDRVSIISQRMQAASINILPDSPFADVYAKLQQAGIEVMQPKSETDFENALELLKRGEAYIVRPSPTACQRRRVMIAVGVAGIEGPVELRLPAPVPQRQAGEDHDR